MTVFKRKGSKYYYYDFMFEGERQLKTTKKTTKSAAEQVEIEVRMALRDHGSVPNRRCPLLRDFLPLFAEHVNKLQRYKAKTRKYYQYGIKLLQAQPKLCSMRLDRISTNEAGYLKWPNLAGSTVNCALKTLGTCLTYALEEAHVIRSRPEVHMRPEHKRTEIVDEYREPTLLSRMEPGHAERIVVCLQSGQRPDECCRMRWEHMLWEQSMIRVPDGKTANSARLVPMTDRVKELLLARWKGEQEGWVYPSSRSRSGHISTWGLSNAFRKARNGLGLPKTLVLYCTRHTYGTELIRQSGDPALVMVSMGHASLDTTSRYTHANAARATQHMNDSSTRRAMSQFTSHKGESALTPGGAEGYSTVQ
jgi:integrase/recombinase XerD